MTNTMSKPRFHVGDIIRVIGVYRSLQIIKVLSEEPDKWFYQTEVGVHSLEDIFEPVDQFESLTEGTALLLISKLDDLTKILHCANYPPPVIIEPEPAGTFLFRKRKHK